MEKKKITIIGCGKMGGAILTQAFIIKDYQFSGVEKAEARRNELREKLGLELFKNIKDAGDCSAYILAVKPQDINAALDELNAAFERKNLRTIVVSIAAGITIDYLKTYLASHKKNIAVIRVMPNTPALVLEGVSAISADDSATDEEIATVEDIFGSMGETLRISEELMDAVTALSGSGPAYFFYLAEVMEKFAIDMGLDSETARKLISRTVLGAGKLMFKSGKSFKDLRKDVTSPGGTTEAAVNHLDSKYFAEIFYRALSKAKVKSEELSKTNKAL